MLIIQLANGLMEGMMLFLVASGLTLIFGVTRIINFAHGSFYMLGAFLTFQFAPVIFQGSLLGFFIAVLIAATIVAVIGAIFEMTILRRIYHVDPLMQLIITVGLVFIIRDVSRLIWGANDVSVPMPEALAGAFQYDGMFFPVFPVVMFGVGLVIVALMIGLIHFTRAGILLRAATDDRGMVSLLGTNQKIIFTSVFAVGSFLGGLAGGLTAPFGNVNYLLDSTVIVEAFIVVVIGKLGNLYGALVGALAVGIMKSMGVMFFPRLSMVLIFLVMAGVLLLRSFGRQEVTE